jgi:hypothetical protein
MKKTKKPKNMVEWFMKHNVSGNICSLDLAITRAIEYQSKKEMYEYQ